MSWNVPWCWHITTSVVSPWRMPLPGSELVASNANWLLHLPDTLGRFQTLPSCFTCERKHKTISRFATPMVTTKSFEKALLSQVLCQEICTLQETDLFQAGAHLVDCHKVSKKTLAFLTTFLQENVENVESRLLKTNKGGPCHKSDVVAFANDNPNPLPFQVGEVQLHLKINAVPCALLKVWPILEYTPSQQHATCSAVDDNLGFVPIDQIVCSLAYTKQEAEAKVLLPYQLYKAPWACSQKIPQQLQLFSFCQLFKALQPASCFSVLSAIQSFATSILLSKKIDFQEISRTIWLCIFNAKGFSRTPEWRFACIKNIQQLTKNIQ